MSDRAVAVDAKPSKQVTKAQVFPPNDFVADGARGETLGTFLVNDGTIKVSLEPNKTLQLLFADPGIGIVPTFAELRR